MRRRLLPALVAVPGAIAPAVAAAKPSVAAINSEASAAAALFGNIIGSLSDPTALDVAFRSYYAFKAQRPDLVRKSLLYFVDYGLPADRPRGYVFDMIALRVVDGPFMVAHGRGSRSDALGIPTRFSNRRGSNASSLGLYLARETYVFRGKSGGRSYRSIGLRLEGLSGALNDNALTRHVVAHGAPYVTSARAGRSEGCPAIEPARAERLLPQLADGGLVFLFSPRADLPRREPWAARV